MEPFELLQQFAETLDRLKIDYLVTGSIATIIYGEPRFTNDIDVVVDVHPDQIDAFCSAFPAPEYYVSADAVRDAVRTRHQFNVIHPVSGMKIDVIVPAQSEFERSRQSRSKRLPIEGRFYVRLASAEDVILRKLEYYKAGGSDKHLRDIAGVLKIQGSQIDCEYIAQWAARMDVIDTWQRLSPEAK